MSLETAITHSIMKYLNSIDGVIMEKVKGEAGQSGRADINGSYKGRSVRIEVKTPDNRNKPSKKQLYNLWQWHMAGAITMVVYSLDAVQKAFKVWDEYKGKPYHNMTINEENNCVSLIMFPNNQRAYRTFYEQYYGRMTDDEAI